MLKIMLHNQKKVYHLKFCLISQISKSTFAHIFYLKLLFASGFGLMLKQSLKKNWRDTVKPIAGGIKK